MAWGSGVKREIEESSFEVITGVRKVLITDVEVQDAGEDGVQDLKIELRVAQGEENAGRTIRQFVRLDPETRNGKYNVPFYGLLSAVLGLSQDEFGKRVRAAYAEGKVPEGLPSEVKGFVPLLEGKQLEVTLGLDDYALKKSGKRYTRVVQWEANHNYKHTEPEVGTGASPAIVEEDISL